MKLNDAFWRFYAERLIGDPIVLDRAWFMNVYQKKVRRHHKCNAHQGEYVKKWVVRDITMTFAAADVPSAWAAPVNMVLN